MNTPIRFSILVLLGLIIIGIMVYPNMQSPKAGEFSVTEQPRDTLNKAMEQGRPVVLEFYAVW